MRLEQIAQFATPASVYAERKKNLQRIRKSDRLERLSSLLRVFSLDANVIDMVYHPQRVTFRHPQIGSMLNQWTVFSAIVFSMAVFGHAKQPYNAAQRAEIDAGRELFQKEWRHQSPDLPAQGNMNQAQYNSLLRRMQGDGLGPMFNATSCEACHAGGAGAGVNRNVTLITLDPRSPSLAAVAQRTARRRVVPADEVLRLETEIDALFPAFISPRGTLSLDVVVHEASTRQRYAPIRASLADGVSQGIPEEWFDSAKRTSKAIADEPVIAGRRGGLDYYLSQRNSPPLFGLGLIDQIQTARMLNIARVQSARSGGKITGRIGDGKFGWRAQTTSLTNFVMGACAGELGLQLPGTPQSPDLADFSYSSLGADLNQRRVKMLVSYVASLPAPIQERTGVEHWTGVRAGKRLFATVGCAACHVENMSPARGIYSDLLLHDMGELLQAPSPASSGQLPKVATISTPVFPRTNRPLGSGSSPASYYGGGGSAIEAYALERPLEAQFPYGRLPKEATDMKKIEKVTWDVLQREWRTPPLWGVADSAPYLHDGRAETIDAAIRWHGGEAADSVTKYRTLSKKERNLILRFLESLRSPVAPGVPGQLLPEKFVTAEKQELASKHDYLSPTGVDELDPLAAFKAAY